MKNFINENWYKLMIGSSLLMASFGFMVYSVSPAIAGINKDNLNFNSNYRLISTNADGSINVKLSDEQIDKIIPKKADGCISVKISPNTIIDVNLSKIDGISPLWVKAQGKATLGICPPSGHGSGDGWGYTK